MELALAAKRKLGFVTGATVKDKEDASKAEQWDSCNDMVISWIVANVSESIKKTVIFFSTAKEVWKNLEQRFSQVSGIRKLAQQGNL